MSRAAIRFESYLARVSAALPVADERRVAILDELRDHLHEALDAARERGLGEEAAAAEALARLGSPAEVAAGFAERPRALVLLLAAYAHLALVLGGALVAIGVSGVAAAVLGLWQGAAFISGAPPIEPLGLDRCAELADLEPAARDCADAWSRHFFEESVAYRVVAGVLGGLLIGSHLLLLRRLGLRGVWASRSAGATALLALAGSCAGLVAWADGTFTAINAWTSAVPTHAGPGWWVSVHIGIASALLVSMVLTLLLAGPLLASIFGTRKA